MHTYTQRQLREGLKLRHIKHKTLSGTLSCPSVHQLHHSSNTPTVTQINTGKEGFTGDKFQLRWG
jgi:sterol desaturase/sphingolipid hydroxylase (fatty acid hydroxylase superfamily)